jgi:hypothetical protein
MKQITFRCIAAAVFAALLCILSSSADAADGKKWDGKKYPFKLLDPSKPNSEANPFIIDTAGKLAQFAELAKANLDMVSYGKKNGLTGLNHAFVHNYVKMTADLDMNGARTEFPAIESNGAQFDGGGHTITNLRISDKSTKPFINPDTGDAEIRLALFQSAGFIKNLTIGKGSSVTYYGVEKKLTLKIFAAAIAVEADKLENCHNDAAVTVKGRGDPTIAGLAVSCRFTLVNSSNRAPVLFEGDVIDSRTKNRLGKIIPGNLRVAGVCALPGGDISGCFNTGSINVKASGDEILIGGIASVLTNNKCAGLRNSGAISFNAAGDISYLSVGGLVGSGITFPRITGYNEKPMDTGIICNTGSITVNTMTGKCAYVGGIGGGNREMSRINANTSKFGGVYGFLNTYNSGAVTVSSKGKIELNIGGIAGNNAMIVNSWNSGSVSVSSGSGAVANIGGLGGSGVYVQNCYSAGAVSAKGTGNSNAGAIIGRADVRWGETDSTLYAVLDGFWLKQDKKGGVNADIRYAKGSYYYMKKSEMQKSALNTALDALSKKSSDPNEMAEDSFYGTVYIFDSPSSAVMKRSDDGPAKRAGMNSTLLAALNKNAEEKKERLYHKWVIDGTNGGYPVLSGEAFASAAAVPASAVPAATPDPEAVKAVAGIYWGEHRHWTSQVKLGADGSVLLAKTGETGTWTFDGAKLVIRWKKYAPETLVRKGANLFSCPEYKFLLRR